MSSGLKILKEFYATKSPKGATKTERGATEVGGRQPESQESPAYLPLVALAAGVAMIAVAFLKPGPRLGSVRAVAPPSEPSAESGDESGWQTPERAW